MRDHLPHFIWQDLKVELSRQFSKISFNSYATQAFTHLQQGCDELPEMHMHHASELLSKIHHTAGMAQIPAEGLNYYIVVYGLNSAKLKDNVVGHRSAYWNTMKDCFSDINAFGAGYEIAKGYSRADLDPHNGSINNEDRFTTEQGPCFKCGEPHYYSKCMKNKGHSNSKLQNFRKSNNSHKFQQNNHKRCQLTTGILSFQASQQIKP